MIMYHIISSIMGKGEGPGIIWIKFGNARKIN